MAKRRSVRRYFRPRFRGRRRTKMTIPLAVVAGFVPIAVGVYNRRSSSQSMADFLLSSFTGISNGQFNIQNMRTGLFPIAGGFLVHMIASRLGINRTLARAGIPLLRV